MKKTNVMALMLLCLALCFGACLGTGPVISKSTAGNLQINVIAPGDVDLSQAEIFIDGIFIGNVSPHMPVIYARRGNRTIRVVAPGCRPFEKSIMILGSPNHQVLNVKLQK